MIKVIVNGHPLAEVTPHLAFQREQLDSEAGAVLTYATELSAQLDIAYLLNANKEIAESEIEYDECNIFF